MEIKTVNGDSVEELQKEKDHCKDQIQILEQHQPNHPDINIYKNKLAEINAKIDAKRNL